MHSPENNRYLFYLKPGITHQSIDIFFKEKVKSCQMNVFIARNNWLNLSIGSNWLKLFN
ncbi:MAG: hypothetical protein Barrevirus19_9 [Barrevirus sp.]|uniref:Uncharacterized protein n=1 Tax=Barrevirus sp. TaxID=2487763 RepID=A0A3G4ZSB9_9VIRU|nr:MAG: hypothetical protein Barrevirus19_9 [Barrevirus sp.]